MRRNDVPLRRAFRWIPVAAGLCLAVAAGVGDALAVNQCFTYTPGHVYYVAYQNNPSGSEYIVDLGDRSLFVNATTNLTFSQLNPGDFSGIFSSSSPNLFVGVFGVLDPSTRDAILSTNGPKDQTQADNSSALGAAQVVDSWATGIPQFSNEVGSPFPSCSLNAAKFPGAVFGSYQSSLNGFSQGNLGQSVAWNLETRLSSSAGTRTAVPCIKFFSDSQVSGNPAVRAQLGFFALATNGSVAYSPDSDGDCLPNVPIGSDPNADRCPGVNSTNNTDADDDHRAVPCDCNDADATVWAIPTEASSLQFQNKTTLGWTAPSEVGTTSPKYDLLRGTQTAGGAVPVWTCGQSDLTTLTAMEASNPASHQWVLYLVRGVTSCGDGPVGSGRNAPARSVPSCP